MLSMQFAAFSRTVLATQLPLIHRRDNAERDFFRRRRKLQFLELKLAPIRRSSEFVLKLCPSHLPQKSTRISQIAILCSLISKCVVN